MLSFHVPLSLTTHPLELNSLEFQDNTYAGMVSMPLYKTNRVNKPLYLVFFAQATFCAHA